MDAGLVAGGIPRVFVGALTGLYVEHRGVERADHFAGLNQSVTEHRSLVRTVIVKSPNLVAIPEESDFVSAVSRMLKFEGKGHPCLQLGERTKVEILRRNGFRHGLLDLEKGLARVDGLVLLDLDVLDYTGLRHPDALFHFHRFE